jgi:hypothetical protein
VSARALLKKLIRQRGRIESMAVDQETKSDSRPYQADVAKLLHMMLHSVCSGKEVFLRELFSYAADAWERLRASPIRHCWATIFTVHNTPTEGGTKCVVLSRP